MEKAAMKSIWPASASGTTCPREGQSEEQLGHRDGGVGDDKEPDAAHVLHEVRGEEDERHFDAADANGGEEKHALVAHTRRLQRLRRVVDGRLNAGRLLPERTTHAREHDRARCPARGQKRAPQAGAERERFGGAPLVLQSGERRARLSLAVDARENPCRLLLLACGDQVAR